MRLTLLFLFISFKSFCVLPGHFELRVAFHEACNDQTKSDQLFERLHSCISADPLVIGYSGAITAVRAKYVFNPFRKYSFCKKGIADISAAILKLPDNIELRYLRLLIESNLPGFLCMNSEMESDKQRILNLFSKENDVALKRIISEFLIRSRLCPADEKIILAVN